MILLLELVLRRFIEKQLKQKILRVVFQELLSYLKLESLQMQLKLLIYQVLSSLGQSLEEIEES